MSDQLLQQIDELLEKRLQIFTGKLDQKFEEQAGRFDQKLEENAEEIKRHTGVLLDGVQHKLELLAEGQQAIVERMDRFEVRLDSVARTVTEHSGQLAGLAADQKTTNDKLDTVAADLTAHRRDTEAHGGRWQVRED